MKKTATSPWNNNKSHFLAITGISELRFIRRATTTMASPVKPPPIVTSPPNADGCNMAAEKSDADIIVRTASLADLEAIECMVQYWAELGENLPREQDEIVRDIDCFVVFESQGIVTGCASLHAYDSCLAEIRSLGIYPGAQGQGQGTALVEHLVEKARQMAIQKVFVLTRVPAFFQKQGFMLTSRALLPEKIMKDCQGCPREHECDEVALEVCFEQ